MVSAKRNLRKDAIFGLLFLFLVLAGAFLYMSRERMIYCWDEANYTYLTGLTYDAFFPAHPDPPNHFFRPVFGLRQIQESFQREYNCLFALPLAFFERAFGVTRTAFVLGATLFFFVPYTLLWSLVATRIFHMPKRAAFWTTIGLILALPTTYLPVLRGFPDVGAAALLGLAVLLYLRDIEMRSIWQRLAIGLVLCLMPLFRRHFMYGLSAFLVAAILQHVILLILQMRRDIKAALLHALSLAGRFLTIGLVILITWRLTAKPFLDLLLGNNYFNLYQSYMLPPLQILSGFNSAYGYLLTLSALLGYALGYRSGIFRSPGAQFVSLLGVLSIAQWMFVVRQQGIHYLNHFNIYIVFGLMALLASAAKLLPGPRRFLVYVPVAAILFYRIGVCFGVVNAVDSPNHDGIVMAQNPPKRRADYDEVKRLITTLRDKASGGPNLFVASCSMLMNSDIIRNGEEDLFGKPNVRLCVLQPPAVDSRDWLPIDLLLKSQYVLTVTPIQYSLSPDQEKLVSMGVDAFTLNTPLARDFEPMPGTYQLEQGCTAKLYRRIRPASRATALQELVREESMFTALPGRQKAWVSIDGDQRGELQDEQKPAYRLLLKEDGYRPSALSLEDARHRSLVYMNTVPAGAHIEAKVAMNGHWFEDKAELRCVWVDTKTGAALTPVTTAPLSHGVSVSLPVPAPPRKSGTDRLLIEVVLPQEAEAINQSTPGKNVPRDGQVVLDQLQIK